MLKETIFKATQDIRKSLGDRDWCVSVFEDNAGIVRFDEKYNVCFKVETHNHPSAIEPYGSPWMSRRTQSNSHRSVVQRHCR